MIINKEDLIKSITASFDKIEYIESQDIPNIDLYMDQVTTFMDKKLKATTRNPKEDKILTKTMINNYAKNDLLPPPERKKYSKEHVLLLVFIYYYKGILSITDIQTLLKPITDNFFHNGKKFALQDIYDEVFQMEVDQTKGLKADVLEKYEMALKTFGDAPEDDQDFLHIFSFICMLSFDVYIKKMLIEKLIDGINMSEQDMVKKAAEAKKRADAKKASDLKKETDSKKEADLKKETDSKKEAEFKKETDLKKETDSKNETDSENEKETNDENKEQTVSAS